MAKKLITVILVVFILPSCKVWNLSYNGSKLKDNYNFSTWEVHGGGEMKSVPIGWDFSAGYGGLRREGVNITEDFDLHHPNSHDFGEEYTGLKLGITPSYYFSRGRFQPFIGCGFNILAFKPRETKKEGTKTYYAIDNYMYIVPHIGMRTFFSQRFGMFAKAGYNIGSVNNPAITINKTSGFYYSLGLTLTF